MIKILFFTIFLVLNLKAEIKNELFVLPKQSIEVEDKLLNLIDSSNKEIIVAMYNFSYKKIGERLINASKKGLDVLLILDKKKYKENKDFVKELENNGIKVILAEEKMHMKVAIFDNSTLLMGSSNWTKESFKENHEIFLFTNDNKVISDLSNYLKSQKL